MSWMLSDYLCPRCGLFEALEQRPAPDTTECRQCGEVSSRTISGTHTKTTWAAPASRAKSDERPGKGTLDTRAIADGMDACEWKAKRAALWRDRDRKEWRDKVG